MTIHSKYSASSADRWLICTGAIKAIEADIKSGKLKEEGTTSVFAEEGTAAHEVAEKCLAAGLDAVDYGGMDIKVGKNKYRVTDEMVVAVNIYLDHIYDILKWEEPELHIEKKNSLKKVLKVDCGGTSDCGMIGDDWLHIIDYKHGKGEVVEVPAVQNRIYGLAFYHNLPKKKKSKIRRVRLTIIQPRAPHINGPIRTEELTIEALLQWQKDVLEPAIKANEQKKIVLKGSIKGCMWCPRAGYCAEAAAHQLELAELEFSDFSSEVSLAEPQDLTDKQIQQIIEYGGRFTKWLKAVHEHARQRAEKGKNWDNMKLVESIGNRTIPNEAAAVKMFTKYVPKKFLYEPAKLLSPANLEKSIRANSKQKLKVKEVEQIVNGFTTRPNLGYKLVDVGARGEAVANSAENDFKKVAKPKTTIKTMRKKK
jgi:hypothetical protein